MSDDEISRFEAQVRDNIRRLGEDKQLQDDTMAWMVRAGRVGAYTYNFSWAGRPVIQYPQDMVALQELVWRVRPDLIVETGIAHGGSLMLSASLLAMLDYCDAAEAGTTLDPARPRRKVLGIDIDIRAHNRAAIEAHPLARRIAMIEGSSIDPGVVAQVRSHAAGLRTMVLLDSNHTDEHVAAELEAYAPLVSVGSYCVVFDTVIEQMPPDLLAGRPWGPGNSPLTAVQRFLAAHPEYELDASIEAKLLATVARGGFLRRRSG